MPESHDNGYCPNPARQTTKSKTQKAQAEPARALLRYVVAGSRWEMRLEPAARVVSFLCQALEYVDDSGILVV